MFFQAIAERCRYIEELTSQEFYYAKNYRDLRKEVASRCRNNEVFKGRIGIALNDDHSLAKDIKDYIKKLKNGKMWGGDLEIGIIVEILPIRIAVFNRIGQESYNIHGAGERPIITLVREYTNYEWPGALENGPAHYNLAVSLNLANIIFQDNKITLDTENDTDSSEEDLVTSASSLSLNDIKYFPRCEFYNRFKGTTQFTMNEEQYWGTYIRSTGRGGGYDRFTKVLLDQKKSKIRNNQKLCYDYKEGGEPGVGHSHTGSLESPFNHKPYSKIFDKRTPPFRPIVQNKVYNSILEYKNSMCEQIVRNFNHIVLLEAYKVRIYHKNNYPCLLVNVQGIKGKYYYKAIMSYYVGIVNSLVIKNQLPIEIVIRSSFGHFCPSVSDTGDYTFRINIGLVPTLYTQYLVQGLVELTKVVKAWDEYELVSEVVKEQNLGAQKYNGNRGASSTTKVQVTLWTEGQTIRAILDSVGDISGKKVISQLLRQRHYSDLLVDYVMSECSGDAPNYAEPIAMMLSQIVYTTANAASLDENSEDSSEEETETTKATSTIKVRMSNVNFSYKQAKQTISLSNQNKHTISNDTNFWALISNFLKALQVSNQEVESIKNNIEIASLFQRLESTHITFLEKSVVNEELGDSGSDSEREISYDGKKYYSRKIVVSSGMKAIMLASYVALYRVMKQNPDASKDSQLINTNFMYYETSKAIKFVYNAFLPILEKKAVHLKAHVKSVHCIHCIDINHCASNPNQMEQDLNNLEFIRSKAPIILDYTSATSSKIRNMVLNIFRNEITDVILLVNSGIKNEQGGFDLNPYGVLRILTINPQTLLELDGVARGVLSRGKDFVPKTSNQIRKLYKAAGFSLTTDDIFNGIISSKSITSTKTNLNSRFGRFVLSFDGHDTYVFDFWEFLSYRDTIKMLIGIRYNISEIFTMFREGTLKTLSSSEAKNLFNKGIIKNKEILKSLLNQHPYAIFLYGNEELLNFIGEDFLSFERAINFIKQRRNFDKIESFTRYYITEFDLKNIITQWDTTKIIFFNSYEDTLLTILDINNDISFFDLSDFYDYENGFCELVEIGNTSLLRSHSIKDLIKKYQHLEKQGIARYEILSKIQYSDSEEDSDDAYLVATEKFILGNDYNEFMALKASLEDIPLVVESGVATEDRYSKIITSPSSFNLGSLTLIAENSHSRHHENNIENIMMMIKNQVVSKDSIVFLERGEFSELGMYTVKLLAYYLKNNIKLPAYINKLPIYYDAQLYNVAAENGLVILGAECDSLTYSRHSIFYNKAREEYMFNSLMHRLSKGENIVFLVGSSHIYNLVNLISKNDVLKKLSFNVIYFTQSKFYSPRLFYADAHSANDGLASYSDSTNSKYNIDPAELIFKLSSDFQPYLFVVGLLDNIKYINIDILSYIEKAKYEFGSNFLTEADLMNQFNDLMTNPQLVVYFNVMHQYMNDLQKIVSITQNLPEYITQKNILDFSNEELEQISSLLTDPEQIDIVMRFKISREIFGDINEFKENILKQAVDNKIQFILKSFVHSLKSVDVVTDIIKYIIQPTNTNVILLGHDALVLSSYLSSNKYLSLTTPLTAIPSIWYAFQQEQYMSAGIKVMHSFSNFAIREKDVLGVYTMPLYFGLNGVTIFYDLCNQKYTEATLQAAGLLMMSIAPTLAATTYAIIYTSQNIYSLYQLHQAILKETQENFAKLLNYVITTESKNNDIQEFIWQKSLKKNLFSNEVCKAWNEAHRESLEDNLPELADNELIVNNIIRDSSEVSEFVVGSSIKYNKYNDYYNLHLHKPIVRDGSIFIDALDEGVGTTFDHKHEEKYKLDKMLLEKLSNSKLDNLDYSNLLVFKTIGVDACQLHGYVIDNNGNLVGYEYAESDDLKICGEHIIINENVEEDL